MCLTVASLGRVVKAKLHVAGPNRIGIQKI
jgi:hypothetical protein